MFNNYTYCCIYFLSFQIITVIVICSFIKGITWEIFTFVESELRKNETLILR